MNYTLEILPDTDSENPRTSMDNLGKLILKNYKEYYQGYNNLDIVKSIKKEIHLPVYKYEHGDVTYSTKPFSCSWDSGLVGFILILREDIKKEYDCKYITKKILETVYKQLEAEIETYAQCANGDVWGWRILNNDDDCIDSCWGYYGYDYCEKEGQNVSNYYLNLKD
jgi:hypothetical protein